MVGGQNRSRTAGGGGDSFILANPELVYTFSCKEDAAYVEGVLTLVDSSSNHWLLAGNTRAQGNKQEFSLGLTGWTCMLSQREESQLAPESSLIGPAQGSAVVFEATEAIGGFFSQRMCRLDAKLSGHQVRGLDLVDRGMEIGD